MSNTRPKSTIQDSSWLILYNWTDNEGILYHCQVDAPSRDHARKRFKASVKFSQLGKDVPRRVRIRQILAPGEPIFIDLN